MPQVGASIRPRSDLLLYPTMPGKWGDDWQQWAGPVPPHPPQPRWDKGWAGWARWARWGCWAGWGGWEDRSGCAERSGGSEDVKDAGAWKDRIGWADWSGWAEDVKSLEVAKEVHPDTHGPWRLGCRCLGPIGDPDDDDLDKDGGICSLGSVFQRCWTCEGLFYFPLRVEWPQMPQPTLSRVQGGQPGRRGSRQCAHGAARGRRAEWDPRGQGGRVPRIAL